MSWLDFFFFIDNLRVTTYASNLEIVHFVRDMILRKDLEIWNLFTWSNLANTPILFRTKNNSTRYLSFINLWFLSCLVVPYDPPLLDKLFYVDSICLFFSGTFFSLNSFSSTFFSHSYHMLRFYLHSKNK